MYNGFLFFTNFFFCGKFLYHFIFNHERNTISNCHFHSSRYFLIYVFLFPLSSLAGITPFGSNNPRQTSVGR